MYNTDSASTFRTISFQLTKDISRTCFQADPSLVAAVRANAGPTRKALLMTRWQEIPGVRRERSRRLRMARINGSIPMGGGMSVSHTDVDDLCPIHNP